MIMEYKKNNKKNYTNAFIITLAVIEVLTAIAISILKGI